MELLEVPIGKLRPDPNQPRKTFDDNELSEMAKSIRTEGVINAIEVDPDYVIITGERRWRASKMAGLKTVPCKVLTLANEERFMRQVIENIHHHTMNDWDTAHALKKLIAWPRRSHRFAPHTDQGIRWLATKTGKSRMYISEKLGLLEASPRFQKAIKQGVLTSTHLRVLERAPKEHRAAIEKKLLNSEFKTSEAGLEVIGALRRSPARAEEILAQDYSKFPTRFDVATAVSRISPRMTDAIEKAIEPTKKLGQVVDSLLAWLEAHPPATVGKHNMQRVVLNLTVAQDEMKKWLKS